MTESTFGIRNHQKINCNRGFDYDGIEEAKKKAQVKKSHAHKKSQTRIVSEANDTQRSPTLPCNSMPAPVTFTRSRFGVGNMSAWNGEPRMWRSLNVIFTE